MLCRCKKFLETAKSIRVVRFYITDNNGHSNLSTRRRGMPVHSYIPTRRIFVRTVKRQERCLSLREPVETLYRLCHVQSDNNTRGAYFSENSQAHELLTNSNLNLKTLTIPFKSTIKLSEPEIEQLLNKDWHDSSLEELLQDFEKLSSLLNVEGKTLDGDKLYAAFDAVMLKVHNMDDKQLRHVFKCMHLWKIKDLATSPSYKMLWQALDKQCTNRFSSWSIDESLLMCDHWYRLKLGRKAQFTKTVITKMGKKPKNLSPAHYLHFMFLLNTCRNAPINMYEVEYALYNFIDKFTANELGIVAMGFFKCQTPLRDPKLITQIHTKMQENVEELKDSIISAIMKITRLSTGLHDLKVFQGLVDKLAERAAHLSIPCLTNIAHATAFVQHKNSQLMATTIERFENEIDSARIKDLERLLWVLSVFAYDPETPIFQTIVDSLRNPKREEEFTLHPKILPSILSHLSTSNIFPLDLIKRCFDPDFLQRTYDNNAFKISWSYFILENNVRIDMPEYDGPFLKPSIRDFLAKKFIASKFVDSAKVRPANVFLLNLAHTCKSVLKSESASVHIDQVLPHYVKSDIVFCVDETDKLVDPEPILAKVSPGNIKYVPAEAKNLNWFAIVLATQNQIIKDTTNYVGPVRCKVRQLKKIGYTPIVVNIKDWNALLTPRAKEDHLREKFRFEADLELLSASL